jgi:hypothetical protein
LDDVEKDGDDRRHTLQLSTLHSPVLCEWHCA